MARIVYIIGHLAGPFYSSLELSRRLVAAGHEVHYLARPEFAERIRQFGHTCDVLTADRALRERAAEVSAARGGWPARWRQLRQLRADSIANDEICECVERLAPDVLLIELEFHHAVITTAALGIPTVLVKSWFTVFRHAAVPPMQMLMMPGRSVAGRVRVRLAWWYTLARARLEDAWRRCGPDAARRALRVVDVETVDLADLRAIARSRDYPLASETSRSDWLRPFTFRHLPLLSFSLPDMEFPHTPHPNLTHVGPMVFRDPRRDRLDPASTDAWRSLRKSREAMPEDLRPALIYASLGTHWPLDGNLLRRLLEVFRRRTDWHLVLALGGRPAPGPPQQAAANVTVLDWAPQLDVLAHADCAVNHGGIGTINECVVMRVPMLVYPGGHVDQNGCASRVAWHGLGRLGDPHRDGADAIEAHLEALLNDPSYRERTAAMAERAEALARSGAAVTAIEALVRSG